MKKIIIRIVNILIFILCFLFLLSSFLKLVSLTCIDEYVYTSKNVLIIIWVIGILVATIFTRPLYQWILHFRYPKERQRRLYLQE